MGWSDDKYEGMTDEELAALVAQGIRQAAAVLARRHYEFIFGYIRRYGIRTPDASDLTQQTIKQALTKLARGVAVRKSYKGFLTYTAKGVVKAFLRFPRRHDVSFNASEFTPSQNSQGLDGILDEMCAQETRNELRDLVRGALERLKPKDQYLLRARYVLEHSVPDLKEIFRFRSETAVDQALHRARERLKKALEAEAKQAGSSATDTLADDSSTPRQLLTLLTDTKAGAQRRLQGLKGSRLHSSRKPRTLKKSNPIPSPLASLKSAFGVQVVLDGAAVHITLDQCSALPREVKTPNDFPHSESPSEAHMCPNSHAEPIPTDPATSSDVPGSDAPVVPDTHDVSNTDKRGVTDDNT